jgi:hypothetical protein
MSKDAEIATWMDKLAIQELAIRTCDAVTRGDWDAFEAVWAPDGVWEESPPMENRTIGGRQIREQVASAMSGVEFFSQMCHGVTFAELTGNTARTRTAIHGVCRAQGVSFVTIGIYYEELVKTDGAWRYKFRRLENIYTDFSPLGGQVNIPRSELR